MEGTAQHRRAVSSVELSVPADDARAGSTSPFEVSESTSSPSFASQQQLRTIETLEDRVKGLRSRLEPPPSNTTTPTPITTTTTTNNNNNN
eukprot:CAMPEP_0184648602 /NCGR_PEP_ID=MMETSP0308-20130426/5763_1 /TAXON_ID=38269 /ORGANISM="Gloeochaete witrockiana, Strain SAG 46.84" /LENGTH=90 /DNA_ID=CAMNT_0027080569 /DNA_START=1 /DNA_END=270 /DNA_ORIENTATION=+